jgi:hypothetical protein
VPEDLMLEIGTKLWMHLELWQSIKQSIKVNDRMLLIAQIEIVFANITKGNACSLRESAANDAGIDPESDRALDVEQRWQDLSDELLEEFPSALIFTNREGFRFLLPAYMRYALNHQDDGELAADHAIYHLCSQISPSPDWTIETFNFRPEETKVIARFVRSTIGEDSAPNYDYLENELARRWEWLAEQG